jgi:predicted amidohydrolase
MRAFRIAAAQVAVRRGDMDSNLRIHAQAIVAAAERGVSVVAFPELSLIGYEPELAQSHALALNDPRLAQLGELAQQFRMHVTVGVPLVNRDEKPFLGAILFAPDGSRRAYAKMHLGSSERAFFSAGATPLAFDSHGHTIGLSICADSSAASHPQGYADWGASVYLASVFLNAQWYATDAPRLTAYASRHRMLVVMANHGASCGTYTSVGRSAIWTPDGTLLAEAHGDDAALVIATHERETWRGDVCPLRIDS